MQFIYKLILSTITLALLCACANNSHQQEAYSTFLTNSTIESAQFKHRVLFIKQSDSKLISTINDGLDISQRLSIFIEGDGSPWYKEKYVKRDPSPQRLLLFDAMQHIEGNKLYIGRPCYFQTRDPNCHYRYWTSHRYGKDVVQSMRDVIKRYSKDYKHIVYVGHSGGGTLATLLACQKQDSHIKAIDLVTMSANLDTDKWTDHHEWSRMTGSQNPSKSIDVCSQVSQHHYVGEKDINVPYSLNQNYFDKHNILPIVFDNANHNNWLRFWPEIIKMNTSLH